MKKNLKSIFSPMGLPVVRVSVLDFDSHLTPLELAVPGLGMEQSKCAASYARHPTAHLSNL
jgi:hypothetical protein